MRAGLLVLAALALGAGQQPARDAPSPADRSTGTAAVAGRITILDAKPAAPVRRAKVTLSSTALPSPEITDTDTEGRYRFDGLPAGDYRITAEKPGFVTLEHGTRRPFERPPALRLDAGARLTADMALPRGAAIEGRLTNEDGEPLHNTIVSAVRFIVTPAGRRPSTVRDARTDDLGRYRIHSLPPGDYYVSAAADPLAAITQVSAPGARPSGFARTYFPGTPQPHEARRVSLGIGEEAPATDFAVLAVPVVTVNATVFDSTGKPAGIRGARLQAAGAPPGDVRGAASGNKMTFPRVPPGEYWLTVTTSAEGAGQEFAAQRVSVAGQDIPDLQVTTAKGASLEVHVEHGEHGGTPPGGRPHLVQIEPGFELPTGATGMPPIPLPPDRRLTLHGVFGPRLFRVAGLPDGWALAGVWLDDVDITDAPFDFRAVQVPRQLRIVLSDQAATLAATVTDADERLAAGVRVVAFPGDERRWGPTSRYVAAGLTDAAGHARIAGLLPAEYLVAAVDYLEDDAWHDPDVLRRLRPSATAVTIDEAGRQTREVSLKVRQ